MNTCNSPACGKFRRSSRRRATNCRWAMDCKVPSRSACKLMVAASWLQTPHAAHHYQVRQQVVRLLEDPAILVIADDDRVRHLGLTVARVDHLSEGLALAQQRRRLAERGGDGAKVGRRSEEHTSELQ